GQESPRRLDRLPIAPLVPSSPARDDEHAAVGGRELVEGGVWLNPESADGRHEVLAKRDRLAAVAPRMPVERRVVDAGDSVAVLPVGYAVEDEQVDMALFHLALHAGVPLHLGDELLARHLLDVVVMVLLRPFGPLVLTINNKVQLRFK